eukprot:TRINITY_DN41858_c0_g1_i1.p1 TRINITY_DN41858_c0_g1~~TRINITY_DN41858_c0_g1_i1.p1  ORF type:complete len:382 (+),score=33.57 TRINITY_DN41858_c0_g1_i1:74-1219(+)
MKAKFVLLCLAVLRDAESIKVPRDIQVGVSHPAEQTSSFENKSIVDPTNMVAQGSHSQLRIPFFLEHTAFDCQQAYKNVVLVLESAREDRIDMLHAIYGKIFKEVFYMSWRQGPGPEMEPKGNRIYCNSRLEYQSRCLPRLIATTPSIQSADGLLACHIDFLIKPSALLLGTGTLAELSQLWQLDNGLRGKVDAPKCFSDKASLDADRSWGWWGSSKKYAWPAAVKAQQEVFGRVAAMTATVCYGWSDLFYLPKKSFEKFLQIAPYFASVFHEVAIPTIINMLGHEANISMRPPIQCAGSCCAALESEALDKETCGHKVNFALPSVRSSWISAMSKEVENCGHQALVTSDLPAADQKQCEGTVAKFMRLLHGLVQKLLPWS